MRHLILPLAIACSIPVPAWGIQAHSGEGLVAHQMGHVLLTLAMALLAFRGLRAPSRGWRRIGLGAALFALWSSAAFVRHGLDPGLHPVVQALSLDHLLLVPALLVLWAGVRSLAREPAP